MNDAGEVESGAPALTRAVAVLEELAHTGEPLGVSVGLAKSTVADLRAAPEATRMVRRTGAGRLLGHQIRMSTGIAVRFRRPAAARPDGAACRRCHRVRVAAPVTDLNLLAGRFARPVDLEHREWSR